LTFHGFFLLFTVLVPVESVQVISRFCSFIQTRKQGNAINDRP
jgi:hypothetical protein